MRACSRVFVFLSNDAACLSSCSFNRSNLLRSIASVAFVLRKQTLSKIVRIKLSNKVQTARMLISSFYYRSRKKEHVALKMRLKELAMVRVRFGYPRLTVLLKREGWAVGKKLVYRLYRELGLEMRSNKRRKLASANRGPVEMATRPNERWSMDFMTDRLQGGVTSEL